MNGMLLCNAIYIILGIITPRQVKLNVHTSKLIRWPSGFICKISDTQKWTCTLYVYIHQNRKRTTHSKLHSNSWNIIEHSKFLIIISRQQTNTCKKIQQACVEKVIKVFYRYYHYHYCVNSIAPFLSSFSFKK